jgi:hypothetical protein
MQARVAFCLILTACSSTTALPGDGGSPGDAAVDRGGVDAEGGTGAGGGGTGGGNYLVVTAATVGEIAEYQEVLISARQTRNGTEVSIVGMKTGEDGKAGYFGIHLAPPPRPGAYRCDEQSIYISTLQLCCPFVYDSRNGGDCSITFEEVGSGPSGEVSGTFSGILYDDYGGRLVLKDGSFRGKYAD